MIGTTYLRRYYMARQQQSLTPWSGALEKLPRFRLPAFFPSFWEDMAENLSEFASEQTGLSISEDKDNVYVEASMPGLKSSDIDVTLDKGILWIRGEKKEEEENKEKKYYRKAVNSFSYRVALPGEIDESRKTSATYQDGMMKITFAKAQGSKAKKIPVKTS
jgi:HSP20 family protein